MQNTLTQYLSGLAGESNRAALYTPLRAIADRLSCQAQVSAGLVIKTGGSAVVMSSASVTAKFVVQGVPVSLATSTDMPALTGTITAGSYNVYCFFIDQFGNLTVQRGTEGTTLALVKFPTFPEGKALVGYVIITYGSTFTGGSTPLDTATTVYISPIGAFDPTILL